MPVLGKRSRFAVEFSVDENRGGVWLFGRICFWIYDSMVGNLEEGTSLRDALFQIEHVLRDRGRRSNPSLMVLPTATVAGMLDDGLFGGRDPANEQAALRHEWARHDVCPSLDIFDGWKLFLVESEARGRLIACRLEDPVVEYSLDAGEFDQILDAAASALNELYEAERVRGGR